jgi:hypothetical protein
LLFKPTNLAIKELYSRSVLEFWVLGIQVLGIEKKFGLSVFLADWVLKNHGKLFNTKYSISNTQYPT